MATVVEEDIPLILQVRLSSTFEVDLLGWSYTKTGNSTVKSGYWLATHLPDYVNEAILSDGSIVLKEAIWKMKTAPKIKLFLWRMLSNTMAIGSILNH